MLSVAFTTVPTVHVNAADCGYPEQLNGANITQDVTHDDNLNRGVDDDDVASGQILEKVEVDHTDANWLDEMDRLIVRLQIREFVRFGETSDDRFRDFMVEHSELYSRVL
jgi:hypothetical protein